MLEKSMSQTLPLSKRVQECLDAGLTSDEGHKYVGIYINGYQIITKLIFIAASHSDPAVRAKAQGYLDDVDRKGEFGHSFQLAYQFTRAFRTIGQGHRHRANRGMRRLRSSEKVRIASFAERTDLTADEHSEVKRIQASIVEGRIASVDYDKMRKIVLNHGGQTRNKGKNGWRQVDARAMTNIRDTIERPDVSDADKKHLSQFISNMRDGRMPVTDFFDAQRLVANNRAGKEKRAQRLKQSDTFENAVKMACQACDNLDDMKIPVLSRDRRIDLVVRISRAAAHLLQLQSQLIQEEEYDGNEG